MCGITGFIEPRGNLAEGDLLATASKMADSLIARGPDDSGAWADASSGVGLGFRRLAILDLSQEGHQPMQSPCGRYTVVYNGEIYNYKEIQTEVQQSGQYPYPFRGHSDTEVLLAAICVWGLEATVKKLNGMFAIALWDKQDKSLWLARDRVGIKPLYYGIQNNLLLFGSELKAICQHPSFKPVINTGALALYFRHNYVPDPHCIYENLVKLAPGQFVRIETSPSLNAHTPIQYWEPQSVTRQERKPLDESEATDQLETLLSDSVKKRMIADVPLGAFLSGGVDSSTVVALMQKNSPKPVHTFSIGFWEKDYNEAEHAKAVAEHLGTHHTELYVEPNQALSVVPKLAGLYDEPFADSSQIPTFLVSQLAKKSVTVSLSGDGGDELFCGYNRYLFGEKIWSKINKFPKALRQLGGTTLHAVPPHRWEQLYTMVEQWVPPALKLRNPGDKVQKLGDILGSSSPMALYHHLVSQWKNPTEIVRDSVEPLTALTSPETKLDHLSFTEQMMYLDLVTYLPGDILTKVDRASMGVGLEARVPILDHRVVEFAWSLPLNFKMSHGVSKSILRNVLYRHVPKELIERPKMGFAIPIDEWLRGPLKDWTNSHLENPNLGDFLEPAPIKKMWQEHQQGRQNWQYPLWIVLMFQAWRQEHCIA